LLPHPARDPEKRRLLVWEIERKLIEDDVRPVLFHPRAAEAFAHAPQRAAG
jgi:hypothetical protein